MHARRNLTIASWNVGILMDIASQVITIYILSKYRAEVACLTEVPLPHFRFRAIIE